MYTNENIQTEDNFVTSTIKMWIQSHQNGDYWVDDVLFTIML